MTTGDTLRAYFDSLREKRDWEAFLADEMDMVVDGEKACALTRYELRPPGGPAFEGHVAEVFEVRDGKIESLEIYFDSAPFPKP